MANRPSRQIDLTILCWGSDVHPCPPSDLAAGPQGRGCAHLRFALCGRILRPRHGVERHPDPGLRDPPQRADRLDPLYDRSAARPVGDFVHADADPALCPALGVYGWRLPAGDRLTVLRHAYTGRATRRHAVPRHGRQRAVDHAQPLHHGPHPQDRFHAGRIAAHGVVDAGLDRRADARHFSLHPLRHLCRAWCGGGVRVCSSGAVLDLSAGRQRVDPPGADGLPIRSPISAASSRSRG